MQVVQYQNMKLFVEAGMDKKSFLANNKGVNESVFESIDSIVKDGEIGQDEIDVLSFSKEENMTKTQKIAKTITSVACVAGIGTTVVGCGLIALGVCTSLAPFALAAAGLCAVGMVADAVANKSADK